MIDEHLGDYKTGLGGCLRLVIGVEARLVSVLVGHQKLSHRGTIQSQNFAWHLQGSQVKPPGLLARGTKGCSLGACGPRSRATQAQAGAILLLSFSGKLSDRLSFLPAQVWGQITSTFPRRSLVHRHSQDLIYMDRSQVGRPGWTTVSRTGYLSSLSRGPQAEREKGVF